MKTIVRTALVWIISSVLFAACVSVQASPTTPLPTVVEPGLAYSDPCKPPCWRGMIPGQTTREEAAHAIQQLRANGWADRISEAPEGYSIDPLPSTSEGSILLSFKNDIINIINGRIIFNYTARQMLEHFDEPEWLYVVDHGILQRSCEEWAPPETPTPSSPIHVLYPKQGLWFLMLVPQNGLGLICPEMRVVAFTYYSPRSLEEVLADKDLTTLIGALEGVTEQDLTKWHGFGSGY